MYDGGVDYDNVAQCNEMKMLVMLATVVLTMVLTMLLTTMALMMRMMTRPCLMMVSLLNMLMTVLLHMLYAVCRACDTVLNFCFGAAPSLFFRAMATTRILWNAPAEGQPETAWRPRQDLGRFILVRVRYQMRTST